MANSSFILKQKLVAAMRRMSQNPDPFVKNPGKDFSRNRKITLFHVLDFLTGLHGQCLDKELLHFYDYATSLPTSSAMIQCRAKVKPEAMRYLFDSFTKTIASKSKYHGFHLVAVDGSDIPIPENKKEPVCHKRLPHTEKGENMLHLNALYHLKSGIFEEILFQAVHQQNEHAALATMLERSALSGEAILVADRGYESYNTFAHIENRGWKYVIRGKQGETGILSSLILPDSKEFDQECSVTICKKHTRKTKEQPEVYKRIRSDATFDFFTEEGQEYTMKFRVVKLRVNDTLTEILFTNLSKEEMSAKELKEIYGMRWGIETAFLQLKYQLGAAAVHSKKAEFVQQELYAKVLMFNYCKAILLDLVVPQKSHCKYEYQINLNTAIDICLNGWRCPAEAAPPNVEELLLKYQVPIREGRSFPRTSSHKTANHFVHRIS